MRLQKIGLRNFLSYGQEGVALALRNLNVIIGINGVGKSNLIDALALLQSAPRSLQDFVREAGGVDALINKRGSGNRKAVIEVESEGETGKSHLDYELDFASSGTAFNICSEEIELLLDNGVPEHMCFRATAGRLHFWKETELVSSSDATYQVNESVLSQRRDPEGYPEITQLSENFQQIRIYRDWQSGRRSSMRRPCQTDMPNQYLLTDGTNLPLVLNAFQKHSKVKARLIRELSRLYEGISDYVVQIEGGTAQLFLVEHENLIPTVRLSDGTLRYLCLLSVLLNPAQKGLVCIEEPEIGLHPDVLPYLAELLRDVSSRCQLIVTTHSDILIDALNDTPESVLVADRSDDGSTTLKRLDGNELKWWLDKYRLGDLWLKGELGGVRG